MKRHVTWSSRSTHGLLPTRSHRLQTKLWKFSKKALQTIRLAAKAHVARACHATAGKRAGGSTSSELSPDTLQEPALLLIMASRQTPGLRLLLRQLAKVLEAVIRPKDVSPCNGGCWQADAGKAASRPSSARREGKGRPKTERGCQARATQMPRCSEYRSHSPRGMPTVTCPAPNQLSAPLHIPCSKQLSCWPGPFSTSRLLLTHTRTDTASSTPDSSLCLKHALSKQRRCRYRKQLRMDVKGHCFSSVVAEPRVGP